MKGGRKSETAACGQARPARRRYWYAGLAVLATAVAGWFAVPQLDGVYHRRLGRQALDDRDYHRAVDEWTRCLDDWPDDAQTLLLLARAHWLAGDAAKATERLNAAKAAGADAARLKLETQLFEAAGGKLEQAEAPLRQLLRTGQPDRGIVYEALIRGQLARERPDEAERLATAWADESPDAWQPHLLRAIARTKQSPGLLTTPFAEAKQDLLRVLELKPDYDVARLLLGNAYVRTGEYREALPHLERFRLAKPDDEQGALVLAECYRALGRAEDARRTIDDWTAAHTGTADLLVVRGRADMDLGRPEEALADLRRAEALAPTRADLPFLLAQALRAAGRADEATGYEATFRQREELARRLEIAQAIAAKDPNDVTSRYEAGIVALRLGQEAAGLHWLNAAVRLDPTHRPSHEALAEYFQQKGDRQAAAMHRQAAGK
ncbi:MAG: tetratricopeptide repeat protein [Gemmataceae bacterium]